MKTLILRKLLEKYERSRHAAGAARVRRRVTLNLKEIPRYYRGDYEFRKSFHAAADELAGLGLIEIEWVRFEEGNLIKALHLVVERVEEAYRAAGQKAKLDILGDLEDRLVRLNLSLPWAKAFIADCLSELGDKLKYPRKLPQKPDKLKLLLDTLTGLEAKGQEEMLERVFSKRYLGNSKAFEQHVRRRLVGILREYQSGTDMEEEAILAEAGLVRAASEVLVCGPLKIKLKSRRADLTPLCYGVSLGTETIDEMEIHECACRRVVSVENKAVFRDLVRTGLDDATLLLCLGGFAGPVKRRFLTKLYGSLGESVKYYHWGDLDFGGMQIFCHLRRACLPGLQPLLMDVATYESFVRLAEPFDEQYGEKLRGLLAKEEFTCFHELIKVMLKYGCVLEQEAIPVAELGAKPD